MKNGEVFIIDTLFYILLNYFAIIAAVVINSEQSAHQ